MSFIGSAHTYQSEYKAPRCCGGCCEVHNGIKWMSVYYYLSTIGTCLNGVYLIYAN